MSDETRTLYDGRYLRLVERRGWELVSRRHRVAVLVAWTPADELLLVEQYRVPVERRTIELPAGLVGDQAGLESEPLLEAARRELEEETGWQAREVSELMPCPTSAGLTDEIAVFVKATDLVRVGDGGGDESEDIVVHAVAVDAIDDWLRQRHAAGLAIDPKIYAALYWSLRGR
ncbi:NUDIX hydrolase [Wenzhouxiangella sp. EGI_FJ10409]|uniref:NUDIX hydrolase n=1 Tax=Wenzhouxiangella sp. EGI_FJ10409 TaxID=3243767 RepID=UPI0035DC5E74